MKKIMSLVLAALMLVGMLCLPVSAARKETGVVVLHNGDKGLGTFSSQKEVVNEGVGALNVKFNGGSFVNSHTFYEEDVSETDALAMDIYVPDLAALDLINEFYVEVSSSGTCDVNELQWTVLPAIKENAVEDEWFTVYLLNGSATETSDPFDDTAVNFMRIYAFYNAGPINNMNIYIDNIRMCFVGGEDFSELNLDAYQGDNSKVNVEISGQTAPDLSKRDESITVVQGLSKNDTSSDEKPVDTEQTPEAPEEPKEENFNFLFLIPVAAAVVIAVVAVVVVVSKKKKV
jgi:hypothetical protein